MFVKEIEVMRKVRVDDRSSGSAQQNPNERPPLKASFRPTYDDNPDKGGANQQHKRVVGQSKDKPERHQRPVFLLKQKINSQDEIKDGKGRSLGHIHAIEKRC